VFAYGSPCEFVASETIKLLLFPTSEPIVFDKRENRFSIRKRKKKGLTTTGSAADVDRQLCESDEGLVLIDQHTAQERILFEQVRKQRIGVTTEFGKGYSERTLRDIRQFYLTDKDRIPPIWRKARAELESVVLRKNLT
jgi:hypothetical protein